MRYLYKIFVVALASLFLMGIALFVDLSSDVKTGISFLDNGDISKRTAANVASQRSSADDGSMITFRHPEYGARSNAVSSSSVYGHNHSVQQKSPVSRSYVPTSGLVSSDVTTSVSGSSAGYFGGSSARYGRTDGHIHKPVDYSGALAIVGPHSFSSSSAAIMIPTAQRSAVAAPTDRTRTYVTPFSLSPQPAMAFNSPLRPIAEVNNGLTDTKTGHDCNNEGHVVDANGDCEFCGKHVVDVTANEATGGVTVNITGKLPLGDALFPMLLMAFVYAAFLVVRRFR